MTSKLILTFLLGSSLATPANLTVLEGGAFQVELKYNSTDNFLKKNIYRSFRINKCWVLKEVAENLKKMEPLLKRQKLKLVLWDCYRPLAVQKMMWKLVPDPRYVADPSVGSNHNRGAAIDVALADENGVVLPFPTDFDDFSPKASAQYECSLQDLEKCRNRNKLFQLMSSAGFVVLPTEWWHFQLPQAETLPLIPSIGSSQ